MHYAAGYRSVMSTPGERLQTARKARGYETATDAANALGIPVATYIARQWEVLKSARLLAGFFAGSFNAFCT